jgi:hypothetical protein
MQDVNEVLGAGPRVAHTAQRTAYQGGCEDGLVTTDRSRPRRPALLGPAALDTFASDNDPAALAEAAHTTAAAIVQAGRQPASTALAGRLVQLVDDHGLDLIADLWAGRPAQSLPGALWRLYLVREWVRRDGVAVARDYAAGRASAQVDAVIAGVADPPGPSEVQALADAVLTGVYRGDLAVALERAAAFCRVIAAGRVVDDHVDADKPGTLQRAAALHDTAADLAAAARAWRVGTLT